MSIHTPALLEKFLENHGFAPRVTGYSVVIPVGEAAQTHWVAFTFRKDDQLSITCQLAVLGDFAPDSLARLSLAALDANTQIAPYAFALIGASEAEVELELCPLVLTDTIPTSDLSKAEMSYAIEKLFEAIEHSREVLKFGHAVA